MIYAGIEYLRNKRYSLIFIGVILKNSKFSPVCTWFTSILGAWILKKVSSDGKKMHTSRKCIFLK